MRQALELALEALETPRPFDSYPPLWRAYEKTINEAITAIKEALAQPEEEKLHPVHIGVDVTREGTAVTAFYRKPDAVMEMFYSQFHPLAQPEQPKVRTGDCLLVGVCASEGHKIQVKQEPWRESASDYERGVIDGRQMQAQSSVDKAVNRMAQPKQDNAYIYASNLAKTIWQKHYMKESPKFALLDTTEGVLTQIDNMTCGLVREKPAQPERSMKVEGPLHVVCQCNKCNTQPDNQGKIQTVDSLTERKAD